MMKYLQKALLILFTLTLTAVTSSVSAEVTYFHHNPLGSTVAATDESGAVLWQESYEPYGERLDKMVSTDQHSTYYTGKSHDDRTGLTYFGARHYDPIVGRFVSIDPVGVDPNNVHSFNRYAYANNNPYFYVDPDGRWAVAATRVKNAISGRWERQYSIKFQKAGKIGAVGHYLTGRASKLIRYGRHVDDQIRNHTDTTPGYVGHSDIGGWDEIKARAADSDIEKAFREKWSGDIHYIPQDQIDEVLRHLWNSTPDDIKDLYKYKSHHDILRDANKHDIPHVSDMGRKEEVGSEF